MKKDVKNDDTTRRGFMNAKSVIAAVLLIGLGIVFGVILVSNFNSMDATYALTNPNVVLGVQDRSDRDARMDPHTLSDAFIHAAEQTIPTVVSINVTATRESRRAPRWFEDFHRFFGPDFDPPQDERGRQRQGSGSGVIASPDGYIITNNHVVAGADDDGIRVRLNDRREYTAKLVGSDENTDLAVLKIDAQNLPAADFGDSDNLRVGEWVLAVGNPLQLTSTVTHGIVSALGRGGLGVIGREYGIENFIQTDAAINPGNSGGPLINLRGEVIGINIAIATTNTRFQGYGFAIPVNLARVVVEDIIHHGRVRRAYLGVQIEGVDETTARALGMERVSGVLVQGVIDGSPAQNAGIEAGDVILRIENRQVNQPNELQMEIARRQPGASVTITVLRNGRERNLTVTLQTLGEDAPVAEDRTAREQPAPEAAAPETVSLDNLGLVLRPLDRQTRSERGIEAGVLVDSVERFSVAHQRNIVPGDIIVEADRKAVGTIDDFTSIIESKQAGDALMIRVKGSDGNFRFVALSIPADPS
jgi:serine protease Do